MCAGASLLLCGSPATAQAACTLDAGESACFEHAARQELDGLIDGDRAQRGLPRLDRVPSLGRAAAGHAADMVERRFFSHVSPGGARLLDRVRESGYLRGWSRWRAAEVLAWGSGELASPGGVMGAWLGSSLHRRALRTRAYREIGVGVVTGTPAGGEGATYAVVLGRRGSR